MKSAPSTDNEFDVIVIGAGISGLTAAYNIRKRDPTIQVAVLEGKDRVGGRTHTIPLVSSDGLDYWDMGGQWVGRCQVHIMKLLEELELKTFSQYIKGTKFQQLGENKVRSYTSSIPSLSFWALLDLQWFLIKINRYQNQLSVEDPFSHPKATEWDAITLAAYLDSTIYTQGARSAIEAAVRSILGCEMNQVSFLYFILYVRMAGGLTNLVEATDYTGQEFKIQGGSQQISKILTQKIGEDAVHLNDAVTHIEQAEHCVRVVSASGWNGRAKFVILAMPPKAMEHVKFNPSLSPDREDMMKRMPIGSMIKVIITYQKAFWRPKNLSGEVVSNGGETMVAGCSSGPLMLTYDATSASGSPALVGFLGGNIAMEWSMQPAAKRKEAVLLHLATFFGDEALSCLDYAEKDWNREPYSWGGPVSYMAPGGMHTFADVIRRPEGRLHFAGTETATEWSGYMNGAIQAGERSALEVLMRLRPSCLKKQEQDSVKSALYQSSDNVSKRLANVSRRKNKKQKLFAVMTCGVGIGLAGIAIFYVYQVVQKEGEIKLSW